MSSYSISIPLDTSGFYRRECPHCMNEFKLHDGPSGDVPQDATDPDHYFCPLCGNAAGSDQWWTQEQLNYIQETAAGPALRETAAALEQAFKGIKGMTYKPGSAVDEPEPPAALHEPDDMVAVASPCHAWEPIKVPEERLTAPVHCVVCGELFSA